MGTLYELWNDVLEGWIKANQENIIADVTVFYFINNHC
jgi:hypothetical protein